MLHPSPWYPLHKRLGEPQSQPVCYADEKSLFPLPEIESRFLSHPACSLDAIPIELPRLLFNLSLNKKIQQLRAHINWKMAYNGPSSGRSAWSKKKLSPMSILNWMIPHSSRNQVYLAPFASHHPHWQLPTSSWFNYCSKHGILLRKSGFKYLPLVLYFDGKYINCRTKCSM
jgi:hypothetical protein